MKIDIIELSKMTVTERIILRNKALSYISQGYKLLQIQNIMNTSQNGISEIIAYKPCIKVDLGSRNETYFHEEEMIQGYKIPNYKDLSIDEKIIFDKL